MTAEEHMELAIMLVKQALNTLRLCHEYRKDRMRLPKYDEDREANNAFYKKWYGRYPHKSEVVDSLIMARKHMLYAVKKVREEQL